MMPTILTSFFDRMRVSRADSSVDTCYICMDDDNGNGAPVTNICACSSSACHIVCLEKLVNSKKSRDRPLAERLTCSVCTRPYVLPGNLSFSASLLPGSVIGAPSMLQKAGRMLTPFIIFVLLAGVVVLNYTLGQSVILTFLFIAGMLMVSILLIVVRWYFAQRHARPRQLDDNAFWADAVGKARTEIAKGRGLSLESASAAKSSDVVIVVVKHAAPPKLAVAASTNSTTFSASDAVTPFVSPGPSTGTESTNAIEPVTVVDVESSPALRPGASARLSV